MEPGRPEGELKCPSRGEVGQGGPEFASQFDANDLGAPIGVESLQPAGAGHDLAAIGAATTELIPRRQAVKTPSLEGAPDLPDRVVRQAEFKGDAVNLLAVEAAADDFLSNRHR
jgi:hypothetical protein